MGLINQQWGLGRKEEVTGGDSWIAVTGGDSWIAETKVTVVSSVQQAPFCCGVCGPIPGPIPGCVCGPIRSPVCGPNSLSRSTGIWRGRGLEIWLKFFRNILEVDITNKTWPFQTLSVWFFDSFFCHQDNNERITVDDKGRLLRNGKLMSDAAVEQRLRRWCTKRKSGALKCSNDVYDRYHNMGTDARLELLQLFKEAKLDKEPI